MTDRTIKDWLLEQADQLEGSRESVMLREAAAELDRRYEQGKADGAQEADPNVAMLVAKVEERNGDVARLKTKMDAALLWILNNGGPNELGDILLGANPAEEST